MDESEFSTQKLPRLKVDIRIAPFHDVGASGEHYLVEVGETCFVADQAMRDLLTALQEEPETLEELSEIYQRQTGREVSSEKLAEVLERRIPDSLFSHTPAPKSRKPFSISLDVFPERWIRPFSEGLKFLFDRRIVAVVICALLVAEYLVMSRSLLVFNHRIHGWDVLMFYLAVIGIAFFHELGHATACRLYDCPHGKIGLSLYFIYPAFYTDVTKAWRLPPRKRAVVDAGGVHFQAILFVVLTVYVMFFKSLFVLRLLWTMNFMMLFTLNPIFKMDGYWLLSDLSGLSNLHQQVAEEFKRLIKKLFRWPDVAASQVQGVRLKVLYAYSILVVAFYSYILHFLYQSFFWVVKYYPVRAALFIGYMKRAHNAGHDLFALYAFRDLLVASVWPFIFCCALFFMGRRIIRLLLKGLRLTLKGVGFLVAQAKAGKLPDWLNAQVAGWKSRWARQG